MGLLKAVGKHIMNNKINTTTGLYFAHDTYSQSRKEGNGVAASGIAAARDIALNSVLGTFGYAYVQALEAAPALAVSGMKEYQKIADGMAKTSGMAFSNSVFNDTQQGFTMRQNGMAIAQRAQYNRQQAMMGNEAKYMFK